MKKISLVTVALMLFACGKNGDIDKTGPKATSCDAGWSAAVQVLPSGLKYIMKKTSISSVTNIETTR